MEYVQPKHMVLNFNCFPICFPFIVDESSLKFSFHRQKKNTMPGKSLIIIRMKVLWPSPTGVCQWWQRKRQQHKNTQTKRWESLRSRQCTSLVHWAADTSAIKLQRQRRCQNCFDQRKSKWISTVVFSEAAQKTECPISWMLGTKEKNYYKETAGWMWQQLQKCSKWGNSQYSAAPYSTLRQLHLLIMMHHLKLFTLLIYFHAEHRKKDVELIHQAIKKETPKFKVQSWTTSIWFSFDFDCFSILTVP